MPEPTENSFLIQRSVVTLKVQLLLSGTVSVSPYKCKDKDLRLWLIISRTQEAYAQALVDGNKTSSAYSILLTAFDKQGWNIIKETDLSI